MADETAIDNINVDFYPSWINSLLTKLNPSQLSKLDEVVKNYGGAVERYQNAIKDQLSAGSISDLREGLKNYKNSMITYLKELDSSLQIAEKEENFSNYWANTIESLNNIIEMPGVSLSSEERVIVENENELNGVTLFSQRLNAINRVRRADTLQQKYLEELDQGLSDGSIAHMPTISRCKEVNMAESPYEIFKKNWINGIDANADRTKTIAEWLAPIAHFIPQEFFEGVNNYFTMNYYDRKLFDRPDVTVPGGMIIPVKIGSDVGGGSREFFGNVPIHDLKDATPFLPPEEIDELWNADGDGYAISDQDADIMQSMWYEIHKEEIEEFVQKLKEWKEKSKKGIVADFFSTIKRPVVYTGIATLLFMSSQAWRDRNATILQAIKEGFEGQISKKISQARSIVDRALGTPEGSRNSKFRKLVRRYRERGFRLYSDKFKTDIRTGARANYDLDHIRAHRIGHIALGIDIIKIAYGVSNGKYFDAGVYTTQMLTSLAMEKALFPSATRALVSRFPILGGTGGVGVAVGVGLIIAQTAYDVFSASVITPKKNALVDQLLDAERKWLEEKCGQKINPEIYRNTGGTVIVPQTENGLIPVGSTYDNGIDPTLPADTIVGAPAPIGEDNLANQSASYSVLGGRSVVKTLNVCSLKEAWEKVKNQLFIKVYTNYSNEEEARSQTPAAKDARAIEAARTLDMLQEEGFKIPDRESKFYSDPKLRLLPKPDAVSVQGTVAQQYRAYESKLRKDYDAGSPEAKRVIEVERTTRQLQRQNSPLNRNSNAALGHLQAMQEVQRADFQSYYNSAQNDKSSIMSGGTPTGYNRELYQFIRNGILNKTPLNELQQYFNSKKQELIRTELGTKRTVSGQLRVDQTGKTVDLKTDVDLTNLNITPSLPVFWNKSLEDAYNKLVAEYNYNYCVLNIEDAIDEANCESDRELSPWIRGAVKMLDDPTAPPRKMPERDKDGKPIDGRPRDSSGRLIEPWFMASGRVRYYYSTDRVARNPIEARSGRGRLIGGSGGEENFDLYLISLASWEWDVNNRDGGIMPLSYGQMGVGGSGGIGQNVKDRGLPHLPVIPPELKHKV